MKREIVHVEPLSSNLDKWKAPVSCVVRHGDTLYVSGLPPFDPETGTVANVPIERQTELVLEQLKRCLEAAGSSLESVLKCNVYLNDLKDYKEMNEVFQGRFGDEPPVRTTIAAAGGIPGNSLVEIDVIAYI